MQTQEYNVVGVMSGTSLDGIDLAHLNFTSIDNQWSFKIQQCETIPYSELWQNKLKNAVNYSDEQLAELNSDYTAHLASVIKNFISQNNLSNLDAVCSHGHTILHQPQNGLTLQIGNLPEIAQLINQIVVCDFRVADVKFGGQGAPLVPIGDRILFSTYDYCLNLGGVSNISFEENYNRIALDISAGNTVLNFYANQFQKEYDNKGEIAESGTIDSQLLNDLNNLDYYKKSYPKSLGFEYVKNVLLPLMESYKIATNDKMRTFCEHIAMQISAALPYKNGKLLVTGGGAYNDFLMSRIAANSPETEIIIPNKKLIEYKEALIFGLLGVLRLRNEINILHSVTGASHDHSSGTIYYQNT